MSDEEFEGEFECEICRSTYDDELKCQNCNCDMCQNCKVSNKFIYSHHLGVRGYNVCSICASLIDSLEDYIKSEHIGWCKITPRGLKWFTLSGCEQWAHFQQINIFHYDSGVLGEEDVEIINKDVETGRTDPSTFSWQIKETLLRVKSSSFKEDIKRVLRAYCIRNSQIGYCQGMNIVTVWLLLFFDHNTAFLMLCYLVEKLLLPDFYIGAKHGNSLNGFYVESTVIASVIEFLMPTIASSDIPTGEFSNFFSLQHLIQLFVSTVDMESTVFLWDKMCEDGSIGLIRGIASLILISERAVIKKMHPIQILKSLNENRLAPQLKETYTAIVPHVTTVRVSRLRQLAKDIRAKQWMQCESLVVKKLEHVSNFSKQEIEELQTKFNRLLKDLRSGRPNEKVSRRRSTIQLPQHLQTKLDDYQGSHTIGISKPEFLKLLSEIAPSLLERGEEIFNKFDEDASGYLDFRELTIAMSVLSKGSFEDKMRICFDAYDTDHSGYLELSEINSLIEKMLLPVAESIQSNPDSEDLRKEILNIHLKMSQLCDKFSGKVFFDDFVAGIKSDMLLYNVISDYISSDSQVSKVFNAINLGTFVGDDSTRTPGCRLCELF
ncbi:hypothetical protein SteCoe_22060 [Stentor coeruleus]|uniref:Rab-GAP TBC domain-containing protein n=1 Tax=Stentor coeruleus TaxID=5963 RepID=A0A1R2BMX2_9CILI|nr:hypothetical protein SteCoe_22060 [Stentor coeruleus]